MGRLSGVPFPSLGPKLSSLTLCRLHATPSPRWQRWRKARGDGLSRTESLVGREKTQKRRTLRALAKGFDCSARVLPTRSEATDDWPVGSKVSGVVIVCRPCDELCPYREDQTWRKRSEAEFSPINRNARKRKFQVFICTAFVRFFRCGQLSLNVQSATEPVPTKEED